MANPWAGEVALELDGETRVLKLTLGALAERFEAGGFKSRDVLALICAGLRGGGWNGELSDLARAEIAGGPLEAARVAARLLALAFRPPQ